MNNIIGGSPTQTEKQQMIELKRLIRAADDVKCDACGCMNFISVYRIRKLSGLMTGTGKDAVIPIPVYACADCGNVNKKFLASVGFDIDEPQADKEPKSDGPVFDDSNMSIQSSETEEKPNPNIKPPTFQTVSEGFGPSVKKKES